MKNDFVFEERVYYDNTDAGGVVYHSKYLDICERARTEFLRNRGIIQSKLINETGIGFVVRKANLEYKKSAKLDDLLKITTNVVEKTGAVLRLSQDIFLISRNGETIDNELLFCMSLEIVTVNRLGKLVRIPKNILELL